MSTENAVWASRKLQTWLITCLLDRRLWLEGLELDDGADGAAVWATTPVALISKAVPVVKRAGMKRDVTIGMRWQATTVSENGKGSAVPNASCDLTKWAKPSVPILLILFEPNM